MTVSIPIYAYDDLPKNIEFLNRAGVSLGCTIRLVTRTVDTPEAWASASKEIREMKGDFAILLDLGFRDLGLALWDEVRNAFSTELLTNNECALDEEGNLLFPTDGRYALIPQDSLDGLGLLLSALTNPNDGRTLAYIASGRGKLGALQDFIDFLRNRHVSKRSSRQVTIMRDPYGANVQDDRFAQQILVRLKKAWEVAFPDFHSDPWINNCIMKWLEFYRHLDARGHGSQFCQHDPIEHKASDYAALVTEMFGITTKAGCESDANGLKVLLQLNRVPNNGKSPHAESTGSGDQNGWFDVWLPGRPDPCLKPISSSCSQAVLKAVVGMNVSLLGNEHRFPIRPSLPFLVSLRLLSQSLREQEGGILEEGGTVELIGMKGAYRLSIPLKEDGSNYFCLARKWAEKCEKGGNAIMSDGVCAALWNASLARVNVVTDAAGNDVVKDLLSLFAGPGRPVAGVSFAPHHIHLHWS